MNDSDILREYTRIIRAATIAQNKASNTLEKALKHFEDERRQYENFNQKSAVIKYWKVFQPLILPVAVIVMLVLCALLFVATGHQINLKAGTYQVQAR